MLIKGVVLLHYARTHIAARKNVLLKFYNWEIFDHPLQSGPGAKRLQSLHHDENLVGYAALPH